MKFLKNCSVVFIISVLLIGAVSCSNASDGSSAPPVPEKPKSSSKTISNEGGVVSVSDKLSINIPIGALSEETNITAKYINTLSDSITEVTKEAIPLNYMSIAEFEPSGTQFAIPAEVSIELGKTPINQEVSIYCFNEEEKTWNYVGSAQVNGTKANFAISHFSKYAALDVTPAMMDHFDTLVNLYAPDDSTIISKFKDYLVNDCHVMDYITDWGSFYYRPRHLLVSGDYYKNGVENKATLADIYGSEYDPSKTLHAITASSTSQSEYIKRVNEGKVSSEENLYVSRCLVDIQYEMIEPKISLSVTKSELKKGESCTLNIWCKDPQSSLDLDGYPLSISSTNAFSVSKSSVTTDSTGRAEITITRKNTSSGTITVSFNQKDTDGFTVSSKETLSFDEVSDGNKFKVVVDYKSTIFAEPTKFSEDEEIITSECPDHSFECECEINGNYEIVPLSSSLQQLVQGQGINGIVIGSAKFKADPSKTKSSYPDSTEKYKLFYAEIFTNIYEYNRSWDVDVSYHDTSVGLVGFSYSNGTVRMVLRDDINAEEFRNPDMDKLIEIFEYCAEIDRYDYEKYYGSNLGVVSKKITTTKEDYFNEEPDSDNGSSFEYYNIYPIAIITTTTEKGTKSIDVNPIEESENSIELPMDEMNIAGWGRASPSELSYEFVDGTVTFE